MDKSYYIYTGGKLSRKDNTLCFETAEGEKRDLPVEQIRDIYIMSEMSLNTSLLNFMGQKGIALHFLQSLSVLYWKLLSQRTVVSRQTDCASG